VCPDGQSAAGKPAEVEIRKSTRGIYAVLRLSVGWRHRGPAPYVGGKNKKTSPIREVFRLGFDVGTCGI